MHPIWQGEEVAKIEAYNRGVLGIYYVNRAHPSVGEVQTHTSSVSYRHPGKGWAIMPRITPAVEDAIVVAVLTDGIHRNRTPATIPFTLGDSREGTYYILEDECDMGGSHDDVRPPYNRDLGDWPGNYFCRKCGRFLQYVEGWRHLFLDDQRAGRAFSSFNYRTTIGGVVNDPFPDAIVLDQRHPNVGDDMKMLLGVCFAKLYGETAQGNPIFVFDPFRG